MTEGKLRKTLRDQLLANLPAEEGMTGADRPTPPVVDYGNDWKQYRPTAPLLTSKKVEHFRNVEGDVDHAYNDRGDLKVGSVIKKPNAPYGYVTAGIGGMIMSLEDVDKNKNHILDAAEKAELNKEIPKRFKNKYREKWPTSNKLSKELTNRMKKVDLTNEQYKTRSLINRYWTDPTKIDPIYKSILEDMVFSGNNAAGSVASALSRGDEDTAIWVLQNKAEEYRQRGGTDGGNSKRTLQKIDWLRSKQGQLPPRKETK